MARGVVDRAEARGDVRGVRVGCDCWPLIHGDVAQRHFVTRLMMGRCRRAFSEQQCGARLNHNPTGGCCGQR